MAIAACTRLTDSTPPKWLEAFPDDLTVIGGSLPVGSDSVFMPVEWVMDHDSNTRLAFRPDAEIRLRFHYPEGIPAQRIRLHAEPTSVVPHRIELDGRLLAEGDGCLKPIRIGKEGGKHLEVLFDGSDGLEIADFYLLFPGKTAYPFREKALQWQERLRMKTTQERIAQLVRGQASWTPEGKANRERVIKARYRGDDFGAHRDPYLLIEKGAGDLAGGLFDHSWSAEQIQLVDQAWQWLQDHKAQPFPSYELRQVPQTEEPPYAFGRGRPMLSWMMVVRPGMVVPGSRPMRGLGLNNDGSDSQVMDAPVLVPNQTQKTFLFRKTCGVMADQTSGCYFFLFYNDAGLAEKVIYFMDPSPEQRGLGYLEYDYDEDFIIREARKWEAMKDELEGSSSSSFDRYTW